MLESIRESSQGTIAKVILGFIILTFAVAGIGSYTNTVDTSVAEVNGEKISQSAFDKAYQAQRNRMAQQFGQMFDTLSADSNYMANFRNGVLDNLINEKLIDQSTNDLAIRISDQRLKKTIREMPEFQVDGVFDNNRYLAIINQAGFFQSSDFRDYLRVEMSRRQLSQALVVSEFNLPYQEKMLSSLQNQKRDIRYAVIGAEQFKADMSVTDEEINSFYQENQVRFENQEQVKVDYIALDVNELAKDIQVSDEDIASYYQDNIDNYRTVEQRRLAHILVEFGDDEAAAESKAEAVLARIKQGEDFAELAKTQSDDTFSGENGGDLDWIEPGVMDEEFDKSAFALAEIGTVSEIVKTSFGYHIIKLTDVKPEKTTPLDELRDDLRVQISSEKAQDKFFELQQELATVSFEFPDSLDDAAGAVDAQVQSSAWLKRAGNAAPFNDAKVINAAFSELVLNDNVNSDVIEIGDDLVMVLRLNEYKEANVKPLSEVQAQIETELVAKKAAEKAKTVADELIAELKSGKDITAALAEVNSAFEVKADISRSNGGIDGSISREAFVLAHPTADTLSVATTALANGDQALIEVQAVKPGDAEESESQRQQQTSQLAQSAYKSYVDSLKVDAKITRRAVAEPTSIL
ncbi:SurA N-terminal domain-containing protein [Thalassomonas actiniarum]|uniref:Periplasmic chaperone PpiD n=1 Tax=Thalassomonas actiniarum TaxID=485447 RepID=A0AAE9YTF6_9GAMM|nr:SurA N-terminal domain-containing protein [Thalassomonas actiniarum]WDE00881.1 SurA N-terminal domain-containing protein [Thalassomonas actiniarum]